jgi:hypothetical protein
MRVGPLWLQFVHVWDNVVLKINWHTVALWYSVSCVKSLVCFGRHKSKSAYSLQTELRLQWVVGSWRSALIQVEEDNTIIVYGDPVIICSSKTVKWALLTNYMFGLCMSRMQSFIPQAKKGH